MGGCVWAPKLTFLNSSETLKLPPAAFWTLIMAAPRMVPARDEDLACHRHPRPRAELESRTYHSRRSTGPPR